MNDAGTATSANAPAAASGGTSPLIWTKLSPPVLREFVSRERILALLRTDRPRKLTLVRAPAGWGKSTLLAEWYAAESQKRPFAWFGLDGRDNDPVLFWTYAIEALQRIRPEVGLNSLSLLRAPGVGIVEHVLPLLVHELASSGEALVLVLEDYHGITNAAIHEQLTGFLEHLPTGLELVISTRSEPPLPLARLRARQELLEIDAGMLRFSSDEAEALLNQLHRLSIPAGDVARLHERTEGWAAGLYLAALSLQGRSDVAGFVADFAGDDRHVVDYLSEEVLAGQPDELREFLLRTSVLERLCGPLCDAVTGSKGSWRRLEDIERSNLFLLPLDTKREWYRYHHLFADLLRLELDRTEPHAISDLHRRAAAWLLEAGSVAEAIQHTIATADWAEVRELIARHWNPVLNAGGRSTVDGWLRALPERSVLADARLCIARAWTSFSLGRLDEVLPWTDAAERSALPAPFQDGTTSPASGAANVRAAYWMLIGDLPQAREFAGEAMALEGEESPWRAVAADILGTVSYWLGDPGEARARLEETIRLGRAQIPIVALYALGYLALLSADDGDWAQVRQLTDAAFDLIEACGASEYWAAAAAHLARGRLLDEGGELAGEAETDMARALDLSRRGSGPVEVAHALVRLARVRQTLADREGARALVAEARRMVEACPDPGPVVRQLLEGAERRHRPAAGGARSAVPGAEELTDREHAVLRLLATELTRAEIAAALYLSANTVKTHTTSIFRKLGVSTRAEAVHRARQLQLL